MAQPNLQKPGPRTAPPAWEATPWIPQERTIEEPQSSAEPALQLSDEHVVDVPLAGDSIVAAD